MDPYIGEIRLFAGTYAPEGWFFCSGQILAIGDYSTLYSLLGTTYGGNGQDTFGLPDLQGRAPVHQGTSQGSTYTLGQQGGSPGVTLTGQQLPTHTHSVTAAAQPGSTTSPSGAFFAQPATDGIKQYRAGTPNAAMATPVSDAGTSQPHDNYQPYVAVNYIIAYEGIYPSPS